MKYVRIDQPLKPFEPTGLKGLIVPLNIAETKLRLMLRHKKLEVTDLDGVFDKGADLVIKNGKTIGWVSREVF